MDRILQAGHRFAIAATILLFVAAIVCLLQKPADKIAVLVVATADLGLAAAATAVFYAYRNQRPIGRPLFLLLFALVIMHVGGYLLFTRFEPLNQWRESFPLVRQLFQTKAS